MINLEDTTYNEARDGMIPMVAGIYPAHVCGLEAKELKTKGGEQTVFNITFLIADEVANTKVAKLKREEMVNFAKKVIQMVNQKQFLLSL